jgi:hypothetical protein
VAVFLAALPAIFAQIAAPKGSTYLGFEYNTDDHMVYAAWMRQAMDGHILFDNRFTTDAQPGLTIHLYFLVLGWIAKLVGIPVAANLGRLFFAGLFVPLLYRLVRRVSGNVFTTRLAVTLTVVGGGVGFLVWHNFGVLITRPAPDAISSLMLGRLPIDVWQPEAFVFPSMLTNGLFMVSLCLILVIFQSFLDARNGWKPVLWGALSIGVLMNIHSYDVLIVGLTMLGFVVAQLAARQIEGIWLLRGLAIAAGVIPAALWFMHVLSSDPVFQARAATPTFSANFRQVFFGYLLMFLLALPGLFLKLKSLRQRCGIGLFVGLPLVLFVIAGGADSNGYFLTTNGWIVVAVVGLVSLALMATEEVALNLVLAWAVMGLVALYFPALFQRKLAMGLSVPWAILATIGFNEFVKTRDRSSRNLATVLAVLLLSVTSIFWIIRRDPYLLKRDVSSTTFHTVFLGRDEQQILKLLNDLPAGRTVAIAMPGVKAPELDSTNHEIPDEFLSPLIPDLNPVLSGLAGVYTFAGHWSETPQYVERRRDMVTKVFLARTSESERAALLAEIKPDYIIQPAIETYGNEIQELASLGEVVYSGSKFKLIRVAPR